MEGNKSWESWWDEEQEHLKYTGLLGRFIEAILSIRFFLYQYGIVYHLNIVEASHNRSITVRVMPSEVSHFNLQLLLCVFAS